MNYEKGRILIVEDDPTNVQFLKTTLSEEFVLQNALDGHDAYDKVEHFRPDLIILDIMMPEMNGIDFLKKIRSSKKYRYQKVIVVSGKGMLEEKLEGYAAGADDYLVKPFRRKELLAKVRVFLRLKHMEEINQIKSSLLQLFAHETQTPLTSIQGYANFLKSQNDIGREKRLQIIERILNGADYLTNFFRKTMLLYDLKSGKKLSFSRKNLHEEIERLIVKKKNKAPERQIKFSGDTSLCFRGDWELIEKAFDFAIDNALKYSMHKSQVNILLKKEETEYLVKISNPGQIEQQVMDTIFEEFVVPDMDHHKSGQGLSLPIIKEIMALHGGKVELYSQRSAVSDFHTTNARKEGKTVLILKFPFDNIPATLQ
ncbi:response regulator [Candidatus Riflebacteria bacterium]